MSSTCGLKIIFMLIIFIIIVKGYAKDISGFHRGHNRLNEYISHYEILNYDHEHIRASHNRAKRSVTKDHLVNVKFSAHGRDFHLRLKRDLNTFSNKLEVYSSNGPVEVSTDHIYDGEVIGDRRSYVFGSILDGVFEGKIVTERDTYYVENAKHYFSTNNSQPIALRRTADLSPDYGESTPTTKSTQTIAAMPSKLTPSKTTSTTIPHIDKGVGFHSIIYKDTHVEDVYKDVREGHVGGCGITEEVSQWMENIQNSAVEELPVPMSKDVFQGNERLHKKRAPTAVQMAQQDAVKSTDVITDSVSIDDVRVDNYDNAAERIDNINEPSGRNEGNKSMHNRNITISSHESTATHQQVHTRKKYSSSSNNNGASDDFKYPYEKYSKEANFRYDSLSVDSASGYAAAFNDPESAITFSPTDDDWHKRVHERVRRASGPSSASARREENKNTCSLYIQTDPLIWRHVREGIADHDRGRKYEIDVKTREEITSLIAHHVTAVNYIYRNTKFDGRTEHRNIRFEVQRIKIDDDSACRTSYNGPHNAFCNEHMDVSNFLNLHSLEDHSDFCLAYVFTYRDFTGGTLGLAWVASASGASGGICEKYKTYTETVGGQYQSTKRSLNTGIITFVNYNSRVPPKVSQLTLAHEIGHNFGSPHDYPQECRPGGLTGNFIMFASATSGDRPNNSKFSPCSIRNISNVLDVLVGNTKRDCFKVSEGAFCGNKIVESGEECDCGFNEEECKDNCCYPRLINDYDFTVNSSAKGCTRRAKTQCSPSQGPCCLANSCTFVPTNYHQKCKEETECSWSSTCNGTTAECPEPKPRDDKTKCNNGTALCIHGECAGSICLLWNMSECFLTSQAVPHVDKRKLCELACQNGNNTATCRSTSEFAHLFGLPDGGISLRPGSPCDNFQGYCDVFLKCRAVDADGPLVRLKNLLLNRETLLTVAQWVTENWYIVVLMGIGFIIIMGIFIKCCAVHTPSSNPKKRRARRISETLRAPMNTLRRMRHHPGRGAGPHSIPPPAQDQHAHHRSHPPEWDLRRDAHRTQHSSIGGGGVGHSIVPLPTGGIHVHPHGPGHVIGHGHATRTGPSSRTVGSGRSSRPAAMTAATGRQTSSAMRSGHGYAEPPSSTTAGPIRTRGLGIADSGVIARSQMPLPLPPTASIAPNQQSQQQQQHQQQPQQVQLPSQAYFAPKGVAPQQVNYNRPKSVNNLDLYADAYAALGRGAYEATVRPPSSKV